MKKIIYTPLLASLLFAYSQFASAEVNLRFSPLALFVHSVSVDLDIPVSRNWTLGPTVRYVSYEDGDWDVTGYQVGVRGNYWFNKDVFSQGWYLGPSISYASATVRYDDDVFSDKSSASGLAVSCLAGYQWMWDTFNINLGLGPNLYTINDIEVESDSGDKETYEGTSTIGIDAEFTIGWKF